MVGDVAPGKVILDRQWIYLATQQRMREQALEFAGKGQAAIAQFGSEKRFYAQTVACQKQRAVRVVVQREGKHAVQALQAIRAPFLPRGEDDLCVPLGPEYCAKRGKLAAQFAEIVNLAVEDDGRAAIGRMHRLGRAFQIDDRQAPMAQANPGIGPDPRSVRSAMGKSVGHLPHARRVHRLWCPEMEKACNPAHGVSR